MLGRCIARTYSKEEDIGSCNNWRGIYQLDVVGKVMNQESLQEFDEEILSSRV